MFLTVLPYEKIFSDTSNVDFRWTSTLSVDASTTKCKVKSRGNYVICFCFYNISQYLFKLRLVPWAENKEKNCRRRKERKKKEWKERGGKRSTEWPSKKLSKVPPQFLGQPFPLSLSFLYSKILLLLLQFFCKKLENFFENYRLRISPTFSCCPPHNGKFYNLALLEDTF